MTNDKNVSEPPRNELQQVLPGFIGWSNNFKKCINTLIKLSRAKAPILIIGESGSGKELAARSCHYLGPNKGQPFIPVNCANFPDHLIESELFGFRKGSFTDAKKDFQGLVTQAEGGTLFLDEINSLSHRGQAALLRFVQEKTYRPIGSEKEYRANVNVITASNASLEELVAQRLFREDLFYRLNVASILIPPLRERVSDIELLANHFLDKLSAMYNEEPKQFTNDVIPWLKKQSWPGNVRQLENWIHRMFLLSDSNTIDIDTKQQTIKHTTDVSNPKNHNNPTESFSLAKQKTIERFEKSYIEKIMDLANGNITHAAKIARKERRSFGRLVKKHGLQKKNSA